MAYAIHADTDDRSIHASIHGLLSRSNLEYYQDRLRDRVGRATGFASRYLSRAMDIVESIDLGSIRDQVDAIRDRYGKRWDVDRIMETVDLSDLQQAKPVMRRWLMANTRARKLYYGDKIYGFGGDFDRTEGQLFGSDLFDYRNVMQGAYVGDDEEDRYVTYLDILEDRGNDELLSPAQRETIRLAWEFMEMHLDAGGQDPTSPYKTVL